MTWQLEGTYFENCSCDMVCPCTTSGLTMRADSDRCQVVLSFHVERGGIDGVDVGGKTVVIVADTPPVMSDGNWRVGVVMDGAASPEQAEKLGALRRTGRWADGDAEPTDHGDARDGVRPDRLCR